VKRPGLLRAPLPGLLDADDPRPGRSAALVTLAVTLLVPGTTHAGDRWPLWPSEVTRLTEPLFAAENSDVLIATEASKLHALRALDRYPTELVADTLVAALADKAVAVRREALQACLERAVLRCIPAAITQWQAGATPDASVRIAAMRVIALDAGTTPAHADILLSALRDPDESLRAEATHTLARVTWPTGQLPRIRTALLGKLADSAPPVRRAAARAIGLLGPPPPAEAPNAPRFTDPAPLALARLLTDPDPQVRQDAADALGALGDPRAAPPLIRALETGDEAYVSRAMVIALALLPGPDVDAALLRLLDAPPRGLTYRVVAEALGRRPHASAGVVDGLVARLREETLQPHVFESLLLLGEAAAPALRAAESRGLEPPLALAVRRLLAALTPPTAAATAGPPRWPEPTDRDAWHARLAGPDALASAAELGKLSPAWLGDAATHALARDHGPELRRPWLLALAAATRALLPEADRVTAAHLARWTADATLAPLDRCLALAALARPRPGKPHPHVTATVARAAADLDPAVRACAAIETRDPVDFAGLLRDDSPRVRATAAFVLASCPRRVPLATQSLVAAMATRDPHPGVLRTARVALAALATPPTAPCTWQLLDVGEPTRQGAATIGWIDLTWQPTAEATAEPASRPSGPEPASPPSGPEPASRPSGPEPASRPSGPELLRLPVHPVGEHRWLLLPGAARLTPVRPAS